MHLEQFEAIKEKVRKQLDLEGVTIPEDVAISTMTMDAKLDVEFNPTNIYKYITISTSGIIKINPLDKEKKRKRKRRQDQKNKRINDTILKKKNSSQVSKKRKNGEEFLNQVTVYVTVSGKDEDHPVSVKIFRNGTLHFTGIKTIMCLLEAVYKICEECKIRRAITVKKVDENGNVTRKIKTITFVDDPSKLNIENLYDFAVSMINCNFTIPFRIDRPKLLTCLTTDGYNATYDSNGHSGVNIKYLINNPESYGKSIKFRNANDLGKNGERVTIFIFESGSVIIILGNQGFRPISEVYSFVYKYVLENYDIIVKDDELTDESIREYIEDSKYKNMIIFSNSRNSTAHSHKKNIISNIKSLEPINKVEINKVDESDGSSYSECSTYSSDSDNHIITNTNTNNTNTNKKNVKLSIMGKNKQKMESCIDLRIKY